MAEFESQLLTLGPLQFEGTETSVYSQYVFKTIKYVKQHNIDYLFETNHSNSTRNKVILDRNNSECCKKNKLRGKKFCTQLMDEIKREQNYNKYNFY